MASMTDRDLLQIPVDRNAHPITGTRWEEARDLAARELGEDPADLPKWAIVRELSEAYTGNQPLGEWQESKDGR